MVNVGVNFTNEFVETIGTAVEDCRFGTLTVRMNADCVVEAV